MGGYWNECGTYVIFSIVKSSYDTCLNATDSLNHVDVECRWQAKIYQLKKKIMKLKYFTVIFGLSMKIHSNEYKQA